MTPASSERKPVKVKLEKTHDGEWTAAAQGLVGRGKSPLSAVQDLYKKAVDKPSILSGGRKLRPV
jgi:hypothetical protein